MLLHHNADVNHKNAVSKFVSQILIFKLLQLLSKNAMLLNLSIKSQTLDKLTYCIASNYGPEVDFFPATFHSSC